MFHGKPKQKKRKTKTKKRSIHLVHTQNFPKKKKISYPLIRTRACAYQGVTNLIFSENFVYAQNG